MAYRARILADSLSPAGHRLSTFEVVFPRIVLAEFNTHRVFSRNSASSRAIPVVAQLRRVLDDPYVPAEFGVNRRGMQAGEALTGAKERAARGEWLRARDSAVAHVIRLLTHARFCPDGADLPGRVQALQEMLDRGALPDECLNVHKQLANRLLEPFMWHTVIVTASEWTNFWNLRAHADAQPEIREIAERMRAASQRSTPTLVAEGEWHLPLVGDCGGHPDDDRLSDEVRIRVAVGRCARVSYLTHGGVRDPGSDLVLHDRLLESGHLSPFEHVARPLSADELAANEWSGNFRGWRSYRKDLPSEADPLGTGSQPATPAWLTPA